MGFVEWFSRGNYIQKQINAEEAKETNHVWRKQEQRKKKEIPENLFELLNSLRKKREDTPSEKILKLALERDKAYDRCKSLSAEIKEAKEKNQDYNFLTIQFNHMDDYKKVLGDQIKKLIDET